MNLAKEFIGKYSRETNNRDISIKWRYQFEH